MEVEEEDPYLVHEGDVDQNLCDFAVREVLRRSQSLLEEQSLQELRELAANMADGHMEDSQYDGPEDNDSQATLGRYKSPEPSPSDRRSPPSNNAALQLLRMVNAKIAKEKEAKANEGSHGRIIRMVRSQARFISLAACFKPCPRKSIDAASSKGEIKKEAELAVGDGSEPGSGKAEKAADPLKGTGEDGVQKAMAEKLAALEKEPGEEGIAIFASSVV